MAASRGWTWSWSQGDIGQWHQAGVRAPAAAQPVSSSGAEYPQDIPLVEAQLSGACGQMVTQGLHLAGETMQGGQRVALTSQPPTSNPSLGLTREAWQVRLGNAAPAGTPWAQGSPGGHPLSVPFAGIWTCPGSASLRGAWEQSWGSGSLCALFFPELNSPVSALLWFSPVCRPGLTLSLSRPKEVSPLDAPRRRL